MKITPIIVERLQNDTDCKRLAVSGMVYNTDCTVLHMHNNSKADCYILASAYPKIQAARQTLAEITGISLPDIKYSYPAMARQVSDWLGHKDVPDLDLRNDLIPVWHYQHCEPALLENQQMFDMVAAYWQIAAMGKSLSVKVLPEKEKIIWLNVRPEIETKWEKMKVALLPHKRLRLAIIGVNSVTGKSGGCYYAKGERRSLAGKPPSWFSGLSLLTVRVAYELTQVQSDYSNTVYANADCISCDSGSKPCYWQDYGINYTSKAHGLLDTRAIGVWKCGEQSTGTFDWFTRSNIDCLCEHKAFRYARPVYHEQYRH